VDDAGDAVAAALALNARRDAQLRAGNVVRNTPIATTTLHHVACAYHVSQGFPPGGFPEGAAVATVRTSGHPNKRRTFHTPPISSSSFFPPQHTRYPSPHHVKRIVDLVTSHCCGRKSAVPHNRINGSTSSGCKMVGRCCEQHELEIM